MDTKLLKLELLKMPTHSLKIFMMNFSLKDDTVNESDLQIANICPS